MNDSNEVELSIERKGTRRSMNESQTSNKNLDGPGLYEICIQGHLDDRRAAWFEGLTVSREENGCTLLTGRFDQAALHGWLRKVRDLGMPLVSVTRVQFTEPDPTDPNKETGL